MTKKIISVLTIVLLSAPLAAYASAEDADSAYDPKGKRDPFAPLIARGARTAAMGLENIHDAEDIILEGIVWDAGGGSLAILNGVIVREGEEIGSIKIERIGKEAVRLSINDVEHKIDLIEEKEGEETGEKE